VCSSDLRASDRSRLADSIETALAAGNGVVEVVEHGATEKVHTFSERYACTNCGTSMPELEPRQFSFNSPYGACEACGGLGTRKEVSPELVIGDPIISLLEGVILPWGEPAGHLRRPVIPGLARHYGFTPNQPWGELPEDVREAILYGSHGEPIEFPFRAGGAAGTYKEPWEGVLANVKRRYQETTSAAVREQLEAYMTSLPCGTCGGSRLRPASRAVTVGGRSIADVADLGIGAALEFFTQLQRDGGLPEVIAGPILKEVRERLSFLVDVGLDYLTLSRSAESLSGGEAQRIRLATQIGSRLVGVLYILDEPSIGLHQRDNARLLATLRQLRDLGNTVIVVEHDEETMREADYLIDLGPGAGRHGGIVVAEGTVDQVAANPASLT